LSWIVDSREGTYEEIKTTPALGSIFEVKPNKVLRKPPV